MHLKGGTRHDGAYARSWKGEHMKHEDLLGAGKLPHRTIERRLPTDHEKDLLRVLSAAAPVEVTGERDDPETALANLLTALATLGLITDSTTDT